MKSWPRVVLSVLVLAVWAGQAARAGVDEEVRKQAKLTALRKKASGPDANAAAAAIKQMYDEALVPTTEIIPLVRNRLSADRTMIEQAGRTAMDPAKVEALRKAWTDTRDEMAKLIAKFPAERSYGKPTPEVEALMRQVELVQTKLKQSLGSNNQATAVQWVIVEAVSRRQSMLAIWQAVAPPKDDPFGEDREAPLKKLVERVTGLSMIEAGALGMAGPDAPPAGTPAWHIWHYGRSRRIEAFNRSIQPVMNAAEWESVNAINTYRESMGLTPLEVDPRLVQEARRSSKLRFESVDRHNPDKKKFEDVDAGYPKIIFGLSIFGMDSARDASLAWTQRPAPHQDVTYPQSRAIGVGKWRDIYTLTCGGGSSIRDLSREELEKIEIKGAILKPEP